MSAKQIVNVEKAIRLFKKNYRMAISNHYVDKPISYALYYTWKWANSEEENRNETR